MAALAAVGGIGLLLASVWTGVSYAVPAPVTDYANYPAPLPASCPTQGAGVLQNVQFQLNGGTPVSNLQDLPIVAGSTVTMTWSGFTPGCEGLGIGLSLKYAQQTTFDPADDQYLHSFTYCGPEAPACTAPYTLSLTMPPVSVVPCGQLDAHIGAPLAVVGPSGSYYSLNGVQNMLISAWNGGTEPCDYPPCPTNPDLPADSILCTSTTTSTTTTSTTSTTAPTSSTTSTTAPTTSTTANTGTAPTTSTTLGTTSTTASATGATVLGTRVSAATGSGSGTAQTAQTSQQIPVTGSETRPWALVAGLLLLAGAPLALIFRRREGRHFAA